MTATPSGGGTANAKLIVAYDGTAFHGFAANAGVRSVMGVLSEAVALVVRAPVELTGAGRTDAGVHAWGQVVSGRLPDRTDLGDLVRRLNKLCAPDVAVRAAEWVPDGFDARFSALWRQYRYDVWNVSHPHPLLRDRAWHVAAPLDHVAIVSAAPALIGEHDFSSFCRRVKVGAGEPEKSRVRNVIALEAMPVAFEPGLLRFEITANAFCHQMVRSIVGTLVDVGLGRIDATTVADILAARSRDAAGKVAPPHGLTLWKVGYLG